MKKIQEFLDDIRNHNIVLPEFQREYVWNREQAKQLLVSLYKKYPVGGVLLWKTDEPPKLKNIDRLPEKLGTLQVILDGQQRLTTLRRCQTNWIGPIEASIEGSQAASWRHSARAAVRCCLKTSRRVRWRWWLKWLWIEAWTAANFCRVLMSLNRAIAPSRLRNG